MHRSLLPPPPAAPPPPPFSAGGPGNQGALFRLLIVSLLFSLNFFALVGVLFRGQNSPLSKNKQLCAHRFSYGLLCLLLNAYLGTWIPYLLSSFLHSTVWPLLEVRTHCAIQHLATTQVSTALLAILCLQKIFETFASRRAKLLCAIIFFTWIFPQSLYTVISELISGEDNEDSLDSLYFLDAGDGGQPKSGAALQTTAADHAHHAYHHLNHPNYPQHQQSHQAQVFSQGVLFCLHRLNYSAISAMTWHYVVLVVPLTSVFIICAGSKQFAKNSVFGSQLPHVNCRCSSDIVTSFVLASNFIWLLFARPLLTLLALLQQSSNLSSNPDTSTSTEHSLPLDLCAHLLLFLLAAVLPFSAQFGLLACCTKRDEELDILDIETCASAKASALKSQILLSSAAAAAAATPAVGHHHHHHHLSTTAAGRPTYS